MTLEDPSRSSKCRQRLVRGFKVAVARPEDALHSPVDKAQAKGISVGHLGPLQFALAPDITDNERVDAGEYDEDTQQLPSRQPWNRRKPASADKTPGQPIEEEQRPGVFGEPSRSEEHTSELQ